MNRQLTKPKIARSSWFQTWGILIVGVGMLVVGLSAGYISRPWIDSKINPGANQAAQGSPNLKDVVVEQTQHFVGDPDAPVTILEFSDFQ